MSNYPYVNFKSTGAIVSNTDQLIFGQETACILDSIWVGNTQNESLYLNVYLLKNLSEEATNLPIITKLPIAEYGYQEILNKSVIYCESGDLIYANTDFSGSEISIIISYRQLNNQTDTPQ